jgi:hypothetical protein
MQLRSNTAAGRPEGSFSDATMRARAWEWLRLVMQIAGVDSAKRLDNPIYGHPLTKKLYKAGRFESIYQDGYDPDGIKVRRGDDTSLLMYVRDRDAYRSTYKAYLHPLWAYLRSRSHSPANKMKWLEEQLWRHGFSRHDEHDNIRADHLGLVDHIGNDAWVLYPENEVSALTQAPVDHFASLDGILMLLLLMREAADLSDTREMMHRASILEAAASAFAKANLYAGEQLHTWNYLVHTRMLRWDPDFSPSQKSCERAHQILLEARSMKPKTGRRGPIAPDQLTQGKSERRWRRQVWACACDLQLHEKESDQNISAVSIVRRTNVLTWISSHRVAIDAHINNAMLAIEPESAFGQPETPKDIESLRMPSEIYKLRKRPRMEENWRDIFGEKLLYDLIPVVKDETSE